VFLPACQVYLQRSHCASTDLCLPHLEICSINPPFKMLALAKHGCQHHRHFPRRTPTAICIRFSKFHTRTHDFITELYKQKTAVTEVVRMKTLATLKKAKPNPGKARGWKLVAMKLQIVQMSKHSKRYGKWGMSCCSNHGLTRDRVYIMDICSLHAVDCK
jgi:hypothetical protein